MKKKIISVVFALFVMASTYSFTENDAIPIYKSFGCGIFNMVGHPVIQYLDNNSAIITWFTSSMGSGYIEYGETQQLGKVARHEIDGLYSSGSAMHRAFLKDLTPGTKYFYKATTLRTTTDYLFTGKKIETQTYSFTTPDADEHSFRFAIVSDTHDQPAIVSRLAAIAKQNSAQMFIFNGDSLNFTTSHKQIVRNIFTPLGELSAEIPVFFMRGNHETRGKSAGELRNFIYTPENGFYFMFRRAGSSLLILDGGEDKPDDHKEYRGLVNYENYRKRQTAWLEKTLATDSWKNSNFKIAINHIPIWQKDSDVIYIKSKEWQHTWLEMLENGKTDILFSAHTHRYEKRLPGAESGHNFYQLIGGARPNKNTLTLVEVTQTQIKIKVFTDDDVLIDEFEIRK
ncbi:MAG: metallophosphoesterase [Spirochaetales bacterium]|nr:metallophosphoesterase [Spirochaetales bacterium]